jgi:plastocyanin
MWTNDDSSTNTVTLRDQPATDGDRSDDHSDLGTVEKIRDELVSNIIINIRNALTDLGVKGQARETMDNSPPQQPLASSIEFESGIIQAGQTFKHTFYQVGTFEYYCTVHPATVGKVVVS